MVKYIFNALARSFYYRTELSVDYDFRILHWVSTDVVDSGIEYRFAIETVG